jgi:hypothetical protein
VKVLEIVEVTVFEKLVGKRLWVNAEIFVCVVSMPGFSVRLDENEVEVISEAVGFIDVVEALTMEMPVIEIDEASVLGIFSVEDCCNSDRLEVDTTVFVIGLWVSVVTSCSFLVLVSGISVVIACFFLVLSFDDNSDAVQISPVPPHVFGIASML